MAIKNEKWFLFKQFLHNELGISKDDIKQWIKEAVKEEAEILISRTNFDPQKLVENLIEEKHYYYKDKQRFKEEVVKIAATEISKRIKISIEKISNESN